MKVVMNSALYSHAVDDFNRSAYRDFAELCRHLPTVDLLSIVNEVNDVLLS